MNLSLEPARRWIATLWHSVYVRFLTYLALGAWALVADPFRLSSSSDDALSRAYHNLQVRLNGVSPPPLTVVMIDNDSIAAAHAAGFFASNDWPLDYTDHRKLLTWVLDTSNHPPAAVFYDIFFQKPRSSSGDLAILGDMLAVLAEEPDVPPLYLAGGGAHMPISLAAHQALERAWLTPTAWSGVGSFYPLAASLHKEHTHPTTTPAILMYQAMCQAGADGCPPLSPSHPAVSVRWGLRTDDNCVPYDIVDRAWHIGERLVLGILQGFFSVAPPAPPEPACLPIHSITLDQLRTGGSAALVPPGVAANEPYGVMIGVAMPSAGDFIPSPVYEPLPGVFLHAMAFENLWRLRDSYLRFHDFTLLSLGSWGLAVVGLMLQAASRHRRGIRAGLPTAMRWWVRIAIVVVLLQVVFHHTLHIVPEGWLSLVAIMPLLREVVLRNEADFQHNKEQGNK